LFKNKSNLLSKANFLTLPAKKQTLFCNYLHLSKSIE
jgi:hypothetical protein